MMKSGSTFSLLNMQSTILKVRLQFRNWSMSSRTLTVLSLFAAGFFFYRISVYFLVTDLSYHTEWRSCPACYGSRMCWRIHESSVHGKEGWHHINHMTNVKNVYFARLAGEELVFKKLAHNDELATIDSYICGGGLSLCSTHSANNHRFCLSEAPSLNQQCDVQKAVHKIAAKLTGPLVVEDVKGLGDAMYCPSSRLVQRMIFRYQEFGKEVADGGLSKEEKMMMLYTLSVNPEPIIQQLFPYDEGWPFIKYIGACGRMIAEQNGGLPLRNYFAADWKVRVKLSLQLLHIADLLTDNTIGFKIYFSDISLDNYVVDENLKVSIADAENVLVVDEMELERAAAPGFDKPHVSEFDTCEPGANCLSVDMDGLCSATTADFNFYAVCRSLLSSYAQDEEGMNGGLLHSLPSSYPLSQSISSLADECAKPSKGRSRYTIKDQLITDLEKFISSF
ncbi:divergent protein kinase domain 2A-like isoform X2 [Watersipora subatra]|uniref:divergent protein kinase domain 2A-like isoform X2 n=1 Tax=Watersipora subatra TaxID=2589382 RepID=UPI00355BA2FB